MANTQKYTEKINKYLIIVTELIVEFLNDVLPKISNKWWEKTVIDKLTDDQKRNVNRKKIKNLDGLDLAALLRIFDMNWKEISQPFDFITEDRNILKDMQTVRNNWSHKSKTGYSLDDIYRDFDTIQRFLKLINTNQDIIIELERIKRDIRQEMNITEGEAIQKNVKNVNIKSKNSIQEQKNNKTTGGQMKSYKRIDIDIYIDNEDILLGKITVQACPLFDAQKGVMQRSVMKTSIPLSKLFDDKSISGIELTPLAEFYISNKSSSVKKVIPKRGGYIRYSREEDEWWVIERKGIKRVYIKNLYLDGKVLKDNK
jgi:hypothetical protein